MIHSCTRNRVYHDIIANDISKYSHSISYLKNLNISRIWLFKWLNSPPKRIVLYSNSHSISYLINLNISCIWLFKWLNSPPKKIVLYSKSFGHAPFVIIIIIIIIINTKKIYHNFFLDWSISSYSLRDELQDYLLLFKQLTWFIKKILWLNLYMEYLFNHHTMGWRKMVPNQFETNCLR